jgi:riboflavin biosynthesis pyrimidine reductase
VLATWYISFAIESDPISFKRLYPPGRPAGAQEVVGDLGLHEPPRSGDRRRPYVLLNMVSTLDGRATLSGRSGAISGAADHAMFRGLRTVVDGVMAGAGTVRTERYGPLVRDPGDRRARVGRGLSEQPLACVVTASMSLAAVDIPLLADPGSRVAIITSSPGSLTGASAQIEYIRARGEGAHDHELDLDTALTELQERLHIRTLLCEGGPHLNSELLTADLVDELFLSLAPKLAGDPADGEPLLRIVAGISFEPALELVLISALESESQLFLRYRVKTRDRA